MAPGPTAMNAGKLTLGPLLFNWPAEVRRDFYARIADEAPVDTVYLGEVVCAKRGLDFLPMLPDVIERLERAGKEVVLSSLALVMAPRERAEVRDLAGTDDRLVEANDIGCAALLDGRRHAIGPFVSVYNEGAVGALARRGAVRFTLPFDLPAPALRAIAAAADGIELEVQVFGRTPLAISARCYHARAHGLSKNACQYVCEADRDGVDLETLEGAPFLAVNGTQTLSYTVGSLLGDLDELLDMGIGRFRLSAHAINMVAVARIFRAVLDRQIAPEEATAALGEVAGFAPFANGFYRGTVGAAWIDTPGA